MSVHRRDRSSTQWRHCLRSSSRSKSACSCAPVVGEPMFIASLTQLAPRDFACAPSGDHSGVGDVHFCATSACRYHACFVGRIMTPRRPPQSQLGLTAFTMRHYISPGSLFFFQARLRSCALGLLTGHSDVYRAGAFGMLGACPVQRSGRSHCLSRTGCVVRWQMGAPSRWRIILVLILWHGRPPAMHFILHGVQSLSRPHSPWFKRRSKFELLL
jgi:hypothetical protein